MRYLGKPTHYFGTELLLYSMFSMRADEGTILYPSSPPDEQDELCKLAERDPHLALQLLGYMPRYDVDAPPILSWSYARPSPYRPRERLTIARLLPCKLGERRWP